LRLAVQRLMSSSIFMLIVNSLDYDVSRFSLGHYMPLIEPVLIRRNPASLSY